MMFCQYVFRNFNKMPREFGEGGERKSCNYSSLTTGTLIGFCKKNCSIRNTPGRQQSKMPILLRKVDQKSIEQCF